MTVQRKLLAKGSKLSIGTVAAGTVAYFGRVEETDLPPEDFEVVEAPELNPTDDAGDPIDSEPKELGDEILGEFKFTHYWDARHADATQLRTWRAAKEELIFQIDTPHPTNAARIVFNGRIKTLAPDKLTKKGYLKQAVTVILTSAITIGAVP